jgi:GPH family glycoside/pentoside/hexuronide:cation symporter
MAAPTQPQKLSFLTKFAFGAGDLGPAIVAAVNGFYLNAFLLQVARLDPPVVALIFLIVKLWDAVNDPIFGWLTDHTHTRWGRRRPWLLFGAIPFGVAFALHWLVPPLDATGRFWYYLVVALLLDTAITAVGVPYTALTPELTQDYDERTSLNMYRFSFSILGGVTAAALHPIIVSAFPDPVTGNAVSAAIWAIFLILPNFFTFAVTREPLSTVTRAADEPSFLEGLRIAFSNRAFILVTLIYLLAWLSIQFVQNNLYLYVQYWIGPEAVAQFSLLVIGVQLSAFIFILIWTRVSDRIGKQNVYYVGMTFWVLVSLGLYFVPRGNITPLYVLAPLAGVGVAVGYLIPWSMLPDVIELDELETGHRREGIFYGFFVFLQKLGISLGIALSNLAIGAAGFKADLAQQPEAVLTTLQWFVSLLPAIVLLISFIPVWLYPINKKRHAEIMAQLEARKK